MSEDTEKNILFVQTRNEKGDDAVINLVQKALKTTADKKQLPELTYTTAEGPNTALELLKSGNQKFDLIICDVMHNAVGVQEKFLKDYTGDLPIMIMAATPEEVKGILSPQQKDAIPVLNRDALRESSGQADFIAEVNAALEGQTPDRGADNGLSR